jgi:hypothetical protein
MIVHMSPDGRHLHTFKFPLERKGDWQWTVGGGDVIVVFSGRGLEAEITESSDERTRECRFSWGLSHPIWTNVEDTVAVRDEDGVVVTEAAVRALI